MNRKNIISLTMLSLVVAFVLSLALPAISHAQDPNPIVGAAGPAGPVDYADPGAAWPGWIAVVVAIVALIASITVLRRGTSVSGPLMNEVRSLREQLGEAQRLGGLREGLILAEYQAKAQKWASCHPRMQP